MKSCSSCGADNPSANRFCGACGSALESVCPSCGHVSPAGQRFCGECGAALESGAPAVVAAQQPSAERRLVSVLFADLVGFTPLSESRDAEEVRELLSRYFDTCRRLIGLYGGTVEKFIGDAVMAVWGTPTATEDDAERAVRAALDLVAAVSALGDEIGEPELRARAGVLTGEAAVTVGAVGEGMVAGDLVNTASRVQAAAEPGSVYVGEATRRASEQAVVYEAAGSFELKGKEGRTPLWRALRVVSGVRGQLRSEGLEAPFVGRDAELRQIKSLFHTCAEERRAQLVSITGIAGIGKSRLVWEFYKYFDGIVDTVWWHRGRCLAYGDGVTYWALADMVRMRCRIAEDDDPETTAARLRETLAEHLLDEGERRFVEPRLGQLLGLGGAEAAERQDLFAAWRLFFERLADSNPVVMVFEDLHWADASLLDFVEYLLEWARSYPLFVVTLARPELHERRPSWGAGRWSFTSFGLEPLREPAMRALLDGLVPGLPEALRTQVLARAEGVPLYAVETVRMLLDRGLLAHEGASYRVVGEIDALEVPETLHAVIAARLDGLSVEERRLLQDGAVLGRTFTLQALAHLSDRPPAELEPLLAALVRKEVLSQQTDPRSPEQGQYGFLQDLVRRVAYETLSRRDRKARHLAAADHLTSSLAEDEVAEVVASHLVSACEAVPDDGDVEELRARAGGALVRAGERAASLGAASEAQRYFEQASDLTTDPLARAELAERAGQMAWRGGRSAEAEALFLRADDAFAAAGDRARAARVSARLAEVDFALRGPEAAVARLEPALGTLEAAEPVEEVAAVAAQLGRFLILANEHERAAEYLERALALAEAFDLTETLAQALNSKSVLLMRRDRVREARALLEAALALALEHDLYGPALRAYNNLLVLLDHLDALGEAFAVCEQALALARRIGDRSWEGTFLGGLASGLVVLGRWDEALARAAEAEALVETAFAQSTILETAWIHCDRGEPARARALLEGQQAAAPEVDLQLHAGYAITECYVLRAEGRAAEALAVAERALAARDELGATSWLGKQAVFQALEAAYACEEFDRARELVALLEALRPGERPPTVRAQLARFRALLRLGDTDAEFAAAERNLRDLGLAFQLAVVQLERAEARAAAGEDPGRPLDEARETFARLDARPWLERAAAVRIAAPV